MVRREAALFECEFGGFSLSMLHGHARFPLGRVGGRRIQGVAGHARRDAPDCGRSLNLPELRPTYFHSV
jgi:hypothetical protein